MDALYAIAMCLFAFVLLLGPALGLVEAFTGAVTRNVPPHAVRRFLWTWTGAWVLATVGLALLTLALHP